MPRATVPMSTKTIEKISLRGVLIADFRSPFLFVPMDRNNTQVIYRFALAQVNGTG